MFEQCILCESSTRELVCLICQCETRALIHSRHELDRTIPGTSIPLFSFASYHGKMRKLVQIAKSQRIERSALVDEWLFFAAHRISESLRDLNFDLVVPIPERRFGWDSRRLLAQDLGYLIGSQLEIPCDTLLLKHSTVFKKYFWTPQKDRNRRERQLFAPSFGLRGKGKLSRPLDIILVDDVCTTGQSLRAAIKPLQDAGFRVSAAALLADTPSYG